MRFAFIYVLFKNILPVHIEKFIAIKAHINVYLHLQQRESASTRRPYLPLKESSIL